MSDNQNSPTPFTFKGWKSAVQFRDALRREEGSEVFNFLYPIAAGDFTHDYSYVARRLLLHLNPPCQLSCENAIKAMWNGWNVSDREVPFYLFKQFGLSQLQNVVEQLGKENLTGRQRGILAPVIYWAEIAAERGPTVTNDLLGIEEQ